MRPVTRKSVGPPAADDDVEADRFVDVLGADATGSVTVVDLVDRRTPGIRYSLGFDRGRVVDFRMQVMDAADAAYWDVPGPPASIGTRTLRLVRLTQLERKASRFFEPVATWPAAVDGVAELQRDLAARPRPGRAGRSARDLARVASVYVSVADRAGAVPRTAELAHLAVSTTYDMLRAAQVRGLLSGYPGPAARLTDAALDLLREDV